MGYLTGFKFKIFRIREAKENEEFLLLDLQTNRYNQYSQKRVGDVFFDELKLKKIDYMGFIKDIIKIEEIKETKAIQWIKKNVLFEEVTLIDNLGYMPCDDELFEEEDKLLFNIYKKSKLLKAYKPTHKNKFPNIKKLMLNLVGDNKKEYDYFLKWLGWQIQNPLRRLPTSIILHGEQGTGKTKFCELVLKPIFEKNFCEIGQTDINKEYNDFILGKQLIVANEVIHNDNKFLVPDKLKNYVTDEYLSINRKFKDTLYTRNYAQWIFVTNNQVPLKIDQGDRRYTVFKSCKLKNGEKLISSIYDNHKEELQAFLNVLFDLDIKFEEVSKPLENEAKTDIQNAGLNSIEQFVQQAEELKGFDNLNNMFETEDDYYKNIVQANSNKNGTYYVFSNLYTMYKHFCTDNSLSPFGKNNFSRHLKYIGFLTKTGWHNEKTHKLTYLSYNEEEEEENEND